MAIGKSQNLVTRSTYAAELLAAASSVDQSTPPLITMQEFAQGPLATLFEGNETEWRLFVRARSMHRRQVGV